MVNEINHPHIVDDPPHVFCVMEHLKGATLGDLAAGSPLSLTRIVHVLEQTCEALHAAHTHGVVHRDVKPANIFVGERNGDPDFLKLLDFGIARLNKTAEGTRTQVGMVIGTPAYMSPEQAQGRVVDARTDLYAVSAVLFELLAGQTLSTVTTPKVPAGSPVAARFTAMKKKYAALVAKHGAAQLTSLERARVGQSMEDDAAGDFKSLASTLPEAEQALRVAAERLGP